MLSPLVPPFGQPHRPLEICRPETTGISRHCLQSEITSLHVRGEDEDTMALHTRWIGVIAALLVVMISQSPAWAGCRDKPKAGVDWSGCDKERLILRGQDLKGANLERADLSESDLSNIDLKDAMLQETMLARARIWDADLRGAQLIKTLGSRADFSRANLEGANLTKSEMSRAVLEETNLRSANLTKAELSRAHFARADLTDANFTFANIARADFTGATLEGVNFSGAYTYLMRVEGVDLSKTQGLSQEQLHIACGDKATVLPAELEIPSEWPCQ